MVWFFKAYPTTNNNLLQILKVARLTWRYQYTTIELVSMGHSFVIGTRVEKTSFALEYFYSNNVPAFFRNEILLLSPEMWENPSFSNIYSKQLLQKPRFPQSNSWYPGFFKPWDNVEQLCWHNASAIHCIWI